MPSRHTSLQLHFAPALALVSGIVSCTSPSPSRPDSGLTKQQRPGNVPVPAPTVEQQGTILEAEKLQQDAEGAQIEIFDSNGDLTEEFKDAIQFAMDVVGFEYYDFVEDSFNFLQAQTGRKALQYYAMARSSLQRSIQEILVTQETNSLRAAQTIGFGLEECLSVADQQSNHGVNVSSCSSNAGNLCSITAENRQLGWSASITTFSALCGTSFYNAAFLCRYASALDTIDVWEDYINEVYDLIEFQDSNNTNERARLVQQKEGQIRAISEDFQDNRLPEALERRNACTFRREITPWREATAEQFRALSHGFTMK